MPAYRVPLPSGILVEYVLPRFDDYVDAGAAVDDDMVRLALRRVGDADPEWTEDPETCPLSLRDLAALKLHLAVCMGVDGETAQRVRDMIRETAEGRWVPLASTLTPPEDDIEDEPGPFVGASTWILLAEPRYAQLRRARDIAHRKFGQGHPSVPYRVSAELLRGCISHEWSDGKQRRIKPIDLQEWPWAASDIVPMYAEVDRLASTTAVEVVAMGEAVQVVETSAEAI